jgi:hypothetical protein
MSKKINFLFVAVVLGLGWAMRGHFGHEWGAMIPPVMGVLSTNISLTAGLMVLVVCMIYVLGASVYVLRKTG